MYRRLDYQLCQIKNYNLTYALFALEPPAIGWDLACHHDRSHCGGTVSLACRFQPSTVLKFQTLNVLVRNLSWRSAVLWADGRLEIVVGVSGRGAPPVMNNSLYVNDNDRFFAFSCSRFVRVRCTEVMCLFYHLLLIYSYIVFIWLSTQTKRKLWRLVSLASGREPS